MNNVTFEMIVGAKKNLKGIIKETDLVYANALSEKTEVEVYLKLENLQKSGSFKIRGAYNKIVNLSDQEKRCGVVASSAGNHAQGVAFSASKLGIKSTIVMPKSAPFAKISATKNYGGDVILDGDIYDDAFKKAVNIQELTGATFVHPFNDPFVIAGQGTIGLEIVAKQPDLDAIFVPIGGGGMAAGVGLAAKSLNPNIKIIGVQSENAPSMYEAVRKNEIETVKVKKTIADGIAVARAGDLTFPIIKDYVDDIVTVSDMELSQAFLFLLETCNLVCEGAGAASVAALVARSQKFKGKKVGAILSGGNIDINMIESVMNHALISSGRRTQIKVVINHQPGELRKFLNCIEDEGGNVLVIRQNRFRKGISMHQMGITVVIETIDKNQKELILEKLNKEGYDIQSHY